MQRGKRMCNGEVLYRLERCLYKPTKRPGKTQVQIPRLTPFVVLCNYLQFDDNR